MCGELRSYKIPTEVTAEIKLNKFLYLTDALFLFGLFVLRTMTIDYVHSDLRWPFTIFLVVVGIVLIIRPGTNPQKRMFEAYMFGFARKRDTYSAIDYSEREGK